MKSDKKLLTVYLSEKTIRVLNLLAIALCLCGCNKNVETMYEEGIMVHEVFYEKSSQPMPAEVDESAIIGYIPSYTESVPAKNGETNISEDLIGAPFAKVEGGIAILYQNEWYLCTAEGASLAPVETDKDTNNQVMIKEWSEQEIISMFTNIKEENWNIIDSVLIPDYAYDRVGAVLFWNEEKKTSNVAFFDADGHYQQCGTYAKIPIEPGFTYLGNGAVTYKLETDDGVVYNYTLTISIDGSTVNFKAEDDLPKQQ